MLKWRREKIWKCKNYVFFPHKLKLYIEVYVKLQKNPPSQRPGKDKNLRLDHCRCTRKTRSK